MEKSDAQLTGHRRPSSTRARIKSRSTLLYSSLLIVILISIMRSSSVIQAFTSLALTSVVKSTAQASTLDQWILTETPIALRGILNNIGANVTGAQPGIVVASPSQVDPNYFYTWTRDAALTVKCLVDTLIAGTADVESLIQDYAIAQSHLQTVSNPSGDLCTGGLAEPKFNVDGTAFTGSWGRPQRDGPALRATALKAYADVLIARGNTSLVANVLWPVIQNDLAYVAKNWNSSTFDLWEEVESSSFFTTAVQYRALIEGGNLAKAIGKSCEYCDSQAPLVLCFLQSYWTGAYALANTGGGRSGKDVNSILTSIHLFDQDAGCDSLSFQPCSDRALANHRVVTDSFRAVYPINDGIASSKGVAIGRYPEDVYQGGHPWYLSNFAAAEQLYHAIAQWQKRGEVVVNSVSLPFFSPLTPAVEIGTYSESSQTFLDILAAVRAYADSYMVVASNYTPTNGALAEQFSRFDGVPLSARDLTWSYAAFLTARNARSAVLPPAWGADKASAPSVCATGSAQGPCSPASITAWPDRSKDPAPCSTPSTTLTSFNVLKQSSFGESILLVGNTTELGSWKVDNAIALDASQYTAADPVWVGEVALPIGTAVEYKYLLKASSGSITWEADPNRAFTVPANCPGVAQRADAWQ